MPSAKVQILLMLAEGAVHLLKFRSLASIGTLPGYWAYHKSVRRLKEEGLLRKSGHGWNTTLHLTLRGRRFLMRHPEYRGEPPPRWDHCWRMVIFDIPEKRQHLRQRLRRFLTALGFARVQKSAWLSPYDWEDRVERLAQELDISPCVLHLTIGRLGRISDQKLAETLWDLRGSH